MGEYEAIILAIVASLAWAAAVILAYRIGKRHRIDSAFMDALNRNKAKRKQFERSIGLISPQYSVQDQIAQAALNVRDGLQAPDWRQHSEEDLAQEQLEEDGLNHSEPELVSVMDKARPDEIKELRRIHFDTIVLGLKHALPYAEEETWLWKVNTAYHTADPFALLRPISDMVPGATCIVDYKEDPFTSFMLDIMGSAPAEGEIIAGVEKMREDDADQDLVWRKNNPLARDYIERSDDDYRRWFTREWMEKAFYAAPRDQRITWANAALDKIFEMKMAQPHANGIPMPTPEQTLASMRKQAERGGALMALYPPDLPVPVANPDNKME